MLCVCSFFRFIFLGGTPPPRVVSWKIWRFPLTMLLKDHQFLVVAKMDMWFYRSFRGQVLILPNFSRHIHPTKIFETTIFPGFPCLHLAGWLESDWTISSSSGLEMYFKDWDSKPAGIHVWCIYLIYRTWILWETSSEIAIWFKAILTILTSLLSKLDELMMKFLVLNSYTFQLMINWWFGARWFGIRIGVPLRAKSPFHFRGSKWPQTTRP